MGYSKPTKVLKPGRNFTSAFKHSKCCVPTEEGSIWGRNLAHTSHHRAPCENSPFTTRQNTMGCPNVSTGHSWNGRAPYYTQVSSRKIFGAKLLVMLFG